MKLCSRAGFGVTRHQSVMETILSKAATGGVLQKKLLKISLSYRPRACNFIKKETLAHVFSCEFCKVFKDACYYRTPLVAAFALFVT